MKVFCAVVVHKLVRRVLLLRDELGRPERAAISNNLPSLGSTPHSQRQCSALPTNYPWTALPTNYPTGQTAAEVGLSVGHLCGGTWRARGGGGGADITHNELEEGQNKSRPSNQPKSRIQPVRTSGDVGTLSHWINC